MVSFEIVPIVFIFLMLFSPFFSLYILLSKIQPISFINKFRIYLLALFVFGVWTLVSAATPGYVEILNLSYLAFSELSVQVPMSIAYNRQSVFLVLFCLVFIFAALEAFKDKLPLFAAKTQLAALPLAIFSLLFIFLTQHFWFSLIGLSLFCFASFLSTAYLWNDARKSENFELLQFFLQISGVLFLSLGAALLTIEHVDLVFDKVLPVSTEHPKALGQVFILLGLCSFMRTLFFSVDTQAEDEHPVVGFTLNTILTGIIGVSFLFRLKSSVLFSSDVFEVFFWVLTAVQFLLFVLVFFERRVFCSLRLAVLIAANLLFVAAYYLSSVLALSFMISSLCGLAGIFFLFHFKRSEGQKNDPFFFIFMTLFSLASTSFLGFSGFSAIYGLMQSGAGSWPRSLSIGMPILFLNYIIWRGFWIQRKETVKVFLSIEKKLILSILFLGSLSLLSWADFFGGLGPDSSKSFESFFYWISPLQKEMEAVISTEDLWSFTPLYLGVQLVVFILTAFLVQRLSRGIFSVSHSVAQVFIQGFYVQTVLLKIWNILRFITSFLSTVLVELVWVDGVCYFSGVLMRGLSRMIVLVDEVIKEFAYSTVESGIVALARISARTQVGDFQWYLIVGVGIFFSMMLSFLVLN